MKRIFPLVIILWLGFGLVKKAHAQPYSVDLGLRTLPDSLELYIVPRMAFDGYVTQFSYRLLGIDQPFNAYPIVFRPHPWITWLPDTGFQGTNAFLFGPEGRFHAAYGFEPLSASGTAWVPNQEIVIARMPRNSPFSDPYFSLFDGYAGYLELNGVPAQVAILEGGVSNDPITPDERSWYVFHHDQDEQLEVVFRQSNPQAATLELLDLYGRTLMRRELGPGISRAEFHTSELPSGIYLTRWLSEGKAVEVLRWKK
jgi:hypothetical protein